jgi:hypothetical protein
VYLTVEGVLVTGLISADGGDGGDGGLKGGGAAQDGVGADGAEGGLVIVTNIQSLETTITQGGTGTSHSARIGGIGGQVSVDLGP